MKGGEGEKRFKRKGDVKLARATRRREESRTRENFLARSATFHRASSTSRDLFLPLTTDMWQHEQPYGSTWRLKTPGAASTPSLQAKTRFRQKHKRLLLPERDTRERKRGETRKRVSCNRLRNLRNKRSSRRGEIFRKEGLSFSFVSASPSSLSSRWRLLRARERSSSEIEAERRWDTACEGKQRKEISRDRGGQVEVAEETKGRQVTKDERFSRENKRVRRGTRQSSPSTESRSPIRAVRTTTRLRGRSPCFQTRQTWATGPGWAR